MKRALLVLLAIQLAGCGAGDLDVSKSIPAVDDTVSRRLIRLVVEGKVDSAVAKLDPDLPSDSARALFVTIHEKLDGALLDSLRPVGARSNTMVSEGVETTTRTLTYQVRHGANWYWLAPTLRDSAGSTTVIAFQYQWMDHDPTAVTAFSFEGKGAGHYLFLVIMGICALTALGTAVWVVRQQGFPRRWWWGVVSLVGAGVVSLNWNTGQLDQSFFRVNLLCFGAVTVGSGAPWILSFAFPAGAVLAVSRVRAWRRRSTAPPAGDATETASPNTP